MPKLVFIWEQTPSTLPFVLRLFFLQVHQTNIPATASAPTDPNTAPRTIPMVPAMHDKLQIIFFQWSYHKESASVLLLWSGNIWNSVRTQFIFFPHMCDSQFITHIEQAAMCNYLLIKKKIEDTNSAHARLKEVTNNIYWIFSPFTSF